MRAQARAATALAAYVLIALVFAWPLPAHFRTHLPTPADGDTAVYVWNVWVFHHEIAAHNRSPLQTSHILVPAPPTDLILHNYTIFADLAAFPLIDRLGVIGAFNAIQLLLPALAAWTMYLLAAHVTRRPAAAWLAGLAFGFWPFMLARGLGHFSLMGAAPLPLFALCVIRALETHRVRYAVGAGAAMAWAGINDPYYAIYCIFLVVGLLAFTYVDFRIGVVGSGRRAWVARVGAALAIGVGSLALIVLATGGWDLRVGGSVVRVRGLYTPVLVATLGFLLWIGARTRMAVHREIEVSAGHLILLAIAGVLTCAALLAPMIPAVIRRLASGDSLAPAHVYWRSSAPGLDLLAFVLPNPLNPLFGSAGRAWLQTLPNGFVENTASLPLVVLATIVLCVLAGAFVLPRLWTALAVGFGLLALGPFVHVGGVNTFIPGPWAIVRYVPVLGAARQPGRLAVLVTLAVAVMFAFAVAHLLAARRRPALVTAGLTFLLLVELSPLPRHLYSARVPSVYETIRDDSSETAVLDLPFGIQDGLRSLGAPGGASQLYQTVHEKPIFGGYISRLPQATIDLHRRDPLLSTLLALSEGREPSPEAEQEARAAAKTAAARLRLGYVVIDTARTTPRLREFAIAALGLMKLSEGDGRELYVPAVRGATRVPPAR